MFTLELDCTLLPLTFTTLVEAHFGDSQYCPDNLLILNVCPDVPSLVYIFTFVPLLLPLPATFKYFPLYTFFIRYDPVDILDAVYASTVVGTAT